LLFGHANNRCSQYNIANGAKPNDENFCHASKLGQHPLSPI
jgi:hypothetical protein